MGWKTVPLRAVILSPAGCHKTSALISNYLCFPEEFDRSVLVRLVSGFGLGEGFRRGFD
jgi:hypothetical protein